MKHIPNIITSLNLASGFIAIIFVLNGDREIACWILIAAMIFDFLDGFASRLLNAYSDLGKELDSLADLVSFGVTPGLIIFSILADSSAPWQTNHPGFSYFLIIAIAALMPVCAGLRLAKFNIDSSQKLIFKGLPTPANALAVISVVFAARYGQIAFIDGLISSPIAIMIYSLLLSVLMITRMPLMSLKFPDYKIKNNIHRYLLVALSIVVIASGGLGGLIFIIPLYILISVTVALVK